LVPLEAKAFKVERVDEHLNHSDRVVFSDVLVESFGE
jgi:hypothetical protein